MTKEEELLEKLEYEMFTLMDYIVEEDTDPKEFHAYTEDIKRINRQITAIKVYEDKRRQKK